MLARFTRRSRQLLISRLGLLVAATTLSSAAVGASDDGSPNATEDASATESGSADPATPETATTNVEAFDSGAVPKPTKAATNSADTSHKGQFALRLAAVGGFHIVMRYDDSPQCAEREPNKEPQTFCGFSAPVGLDAAIGYAPLASVEPFIWGRFGLSEETQTHTKPQLMFGAGVRLYPMSESRFKFFVEPSVGAEFESGTDDSPDPSSAYKQDFVLRLAVGPQYDFNRYVGIYVAGAMSVGVIRSLNAAMEGHGGVQARFP